ncbi:gibberellin 2-oxidase protein [Rutstroemia sp. NJR-2017a WRK4]|nr:gibberellin 2-oxidase protein [Rutstroemia sp. NJR-2017a WRK4]
MDLPTLDFSLFASDRNKERNQFAKELVESFLNHGFVKLTNHGIPETLVQALLRSPKTKDLFDLDITAKKKIENLKGPHPQRGWSCKGAEVTAKLYKKNLHNNSNGDELKDEREFFDMGPPGDCLYPNKWPSEELPSLKSTLETSYRLLHDTSLQIVAAIEVGLELPSGTLVQRCIPAASEIRLNHYPPASLELLNDGKSKRTWPHTDFGIITLLFQDQVGGLELENRTEPYTFVPVIPGKPGDPSELVVNISDTFQRWTNDVIRAGLHRVDVPISMKGKTTGLCPDRYSSIYFFKAARDTSVGPLPAFVTEENPAKYDDITALQFQQQMTKILY